MFGALMVEFRDSQISHGNQCETVFILKGGEKSGPFGYQTGSASKISVGCLVSVFIHNHQDFDSQLIYFIFFLSD